MRDNLFLFTGPDNFFLRQELTKRTQGFAQKYGAENCVRFTCDNITPQGIQEALQGGGLFATKKMIICDGIPEDKVTRSKPPAAVISFLEGVLDNASSPLSPDTILVFVSIDPDKRGKLYKLLTEKAQNKTFAVPTPSEYAKHIRGWLGDFYTDDIKDHLITYVGSDTSRIALECDKIRIYMQAHGLKELDTATLSAIVYSALESNSFVVLDAITTGKSAQALKGIAAAAHDETNWNEFIGMLYRGLKHTLLTIDLYSHGTTQAKDIASAAGVQPFAITKNLKHIDSLIARKKSLTQLFHDCIQLDADIKGGRIPQEGFWAEIATRIQHSM